MLIRDAFLLPTAYARLDRLFELWSDTKIGLAGMRIPEVLSRQPAIVAMLSWMIRGPRHRHIDRVMFALECIPPAVVMKFLHSRKLLTPKMRSHILDTHAKAMTTIDMTQMSESTVLACKTKFHLVYSIYLNLDDMYYNKSTTATFRGEERSLKVIYIRKRVLLEFDPEAAGAFVMIGNTVRYCESCLVEVTVTSKDSHMLVVPFYLSSHRERRRFVDGQRGCQ